MTVSELRDILEGVDENIEVCIAHFQRYGSDLANDISRVQVGYRAGYWTDGYTKTLQLVMGEGIGTPMTEQDYYDEMVYGDHEEEE